jgi:hypothetical protein
MCVIPCLPEIPVKTLHMPFDSGVYGGIATTQPPSSAKLSLDEAVEKSKGRHLEFDDGVMKYRPLFLYIQIAPNWYPSLLDSGCGCSMIKSSFFKTIYGSSAVLGVYKNIG